MDDMTFSPTSATPDVLAALTRFVRILIHGGGDGGGIPAAEWDCKQELRRLSKDEAYIDNAIAYAWSIGDAEWQKRQLSEQL